LRWFLFTVVFTVNKPQIITAVRTNKQKKRSFAALTNDHVLEQWFWSGVVFYSSCDARQAEANLHGLIWARLLVSARAEAIHFFIKLQTLGSISCALAQARLRTVAVTCWW
jgi:hypothetical protein